MSRIIKKKYIERYFGFTVGFVVAILCYYFQLKLPNYKDAIINLYPLMIGAFGFLLTLFGLVLNNSVLHLTDEEKVSKKEKDQIKRIMYRKFVSLNKITVFTALFLSIYSYIITNFPMPQFLCKTCADIIRNFALSLWLGWVVAFLWLLIYFIYIFFLTFTIKSE